MPKVLITAGEPAGIGPDILIQLAQQNALQHCVIIADQHCLKERAQLHGATIRMQPHNIHSEQPLSSDPNVIHVHHVPLPSKVIIGQPQVQHADHIIATLQLAVNACLQQPHTALVTLPIQKATIKEAGYDFNGHTEFLATTCQCDTVMSFDTDAIKLALVTDHCPLSNVPALVTAKRIDATINALIHYCQHRGIEHPRIAVCGLNPHAGEAGHLGQEEQHYIKKQCQAWRDQGHHISGPIPACTAMTPPVLKQFDGIVSMYHDQLLPALKALYFDEAVNVTLGLPFTRTSPDHGTALSLAGQPDGIQTKSSLRAIQLARDMRMQSPV